MNAQELENQIRRAMPGDQFQLRRKLRQLLRHPQDGPSAKRLERLREQISQSCELLEFRRRNLPRYEFPDELPITAKAVEIQQLIQTHQVMIVCGDTGSGKSTQLPKICLAAGRGVGGMIGHTQPRRLAARSVAARLAEELNSPLGEAVGFKIRFTDQTRPQTYVKLMTDGILLAETQHDRFLNQYDTIIIDEAHERSLNIDFLLGYLHRLLPKRPDLRVIITSATIDAERFAAHFGQDEEPAPVIQVSGRMYPVEVRYRSAAEIEDEQFAQQLQDAVEEVLSAGPGDVLVFLPTERDIRDASRSLRGLATSRGHDVDILPLYARLTAKEQNRIFHPQGKRRVILATNVAESSLTVPGIRYVVDSGTARISRYSARSKIQRLPIEPVSQASADQRKGRSGRLGPGVCIRLYTEEDFLSRDRFTTPEIRRTNLASVILQTKALKLGAIDDFPFLDPPRPEAIRDGYRTLFELGAIDHNRELTQLGRRLAALPVDPRIARMIVAGADENCLAEVLIIAAALEIQDPRERPVDKQQAADEKHARYLDESSDFSSYLKLWDHYHNLRESCSRNGLKKACHQQFLSSTRLREWSDIHRQLKQLVQAVGLKTQPRRDDYPAIHRALLTGLLSGVALRGDANEYTGAGGNKYFLWPGSGLFSERPRWIMAAELVETTRRYARTVAVIDPAWIEPLAKHLVKTSHFDPHWHRKSESPVVYERVTLFGLTIIPKRRTRLKNVDPDAARQLLIEHGLVQGELRNPPPFVEHNQMLHLELTEEAARTRQRDRIIGEHLLIDFYQEHLPEAIADTADLRKWYQRCSPEEQQSLFMTREDLIAGSSDDLRPYFPDQVTLNQLKLPLNYCFEPGTARDGVTVTVPRRALRQVRSEQLGWLVPGMLEEKLLCLIRSLPKSLRRCFVPAPDTAKRLAAELSFGEGPFLSTVTRKMQEMAGEPISAADFDLSKLPEHLKMNIRLIDDDGTTLATSRDLEHLIEEFARDLDQETVAISHPDWDRQGVTNWDFGTLPKSVDVQAGDIPVKGYPAIVDCQDSVHLRLADNRALAKQLSRAGIRRLYVLSHRSELREQVAWLPKMNEMRMYAGSLPGPDLEASLIDLLADRAFLFQPGLPGCEQEYREREQLGLKRIAAAVQEITSLSYNILHEHHQVRLALEDVPARQYSDVIGDVRQQLKALTRPEFWTTTPWMWLKHYPRFFKAVAYRLDKLTHGGQQKDRLAMDQLRPYLEQCRQLQEDHQKRAIFDPEWVLFRWMVEEYRVSLFAQPLGTSVSVSPQKLDKQLAKVAT